MMCVGIRTLLVGGFGYLLSGCAGDRPMIGRGDAQTMDASINDAGVFEGERCSLIGGENYETLGTYGPITPIPAALHPDLNVKVRDWSATEGALELVDVDGPTDPGAPKLNSLFNPARLPEF